tara:strand:- start:10639 stop:10857 length:219 start_codon:yes stop_codon:yes gene_type:complete
MIIMALGTVEVVALVVFGVLIFGVDKIPKLARSVGLAKGEYQKAVNEVARPSKTEMDMDRGGQTEEFLSEEE